MPCSGWSALNEMNSNLKKKNSHRSSVGLTWHTENRYSEVPKRKSLLCIASSHLIRLSNSLFGRRKYDFVLLFIWLPLCQF